VFTDREADGVNLCEVFWDGRSEFSMEKSFDKWNQSIRFFFQTIKNINLVLTIDQFKELNNNKKALMLQPYNPFLWKESWLSQKYLYKYYIK
jgi:hypothetical protein